MDIGSIVSNALGGIIASLFVLLLLNMGKKIHAKRKQHPSQLQEVLDKAILESPEYQEILSNRKFHRVAGYGAAIWFLSLVVVIIIAWVLNGKISLHYQSIWDAISSIGLLISLACLSPLLFYFGYSPITLKEVELKRQASRQKTLKEAHGARPYGYIFQEIMFPVIFWLYLIFCVFGLFYLLTFPPSIIHVPLPLTVVVDGFAIFAALFGTYISIKKIYWSVKHLPYVPLQRRDELRKQFTNHEFD